MGEHPASTMPSQMLMEATEANRVEVDKNDQLKINRFNRINNRKHELLAMTKNLKEHLSNLEDAETEMMLLDDTDNFMFAIGSDFTRNSVPETFVHCDTDSAEEQLEALKNEAEAKVTEHETELATILTEMDELKTQLYAKFGKTINLEE